MTRTKQRQQTNMENCYPGSFFTARLFKATTVRLEQWFMSSVG